jgi:hypothetical protein
VSTIEEREDTPPEEEWNEVLRIREKLKGLESGN